MSDWRDGYDDWKLRSPDWDDDPCAEVRAECAAEARDLDEKIHELSTLLRTVLDGTFNDPVEYALWRSEVYRALDLPDPNRPPEEEIVF
jgi:hypothetical protein